MNQASAYSSYNVKDPAYGAKGDGVADDTSAIQAAIDVCGAAGGGVVYLPEGSYKISSTLVVGNASGGATSTYNGVSLVGAGGVSTDAFGNAATLLSWAGSTGGTMVEINGPIGAWGVQNMWLYGGAGAAKGLYVISGQGGYASNLQFYGCTDSISTTSVSGGTHSAGLNRWHGITIYVPTVNNSHAVLIDGNSDGLSNTCFEDFQSVSIVYQSTSNTQYGFYLKRCDNIRGRGMVFNASAGKNVFTFDYTGHTGWPCDCTFEQVDLGSTTAVVSNVGTPPLNNGGASQHNRISDVSQGNGRPNNPALLGLEFGDVTTGTATLTWPGGGTQSNVPSIPHGLGVPPRAISLTVDSFSGVNCAPALENMRTFTDSTNFAPRATTIDGQLPLNTATVTITWMARG